MAYMMSVLVIVSLEEWFKPLSEYAEMVIWKNGFRSIIVIRLKKTKKNK